MKYDITHLNKTFSTINYDPKISDEVCNQVREDFYKKPDIELVDKQLVKLFNGGKMHNHVIDYFIKEVLITSKLKSSKWSIDEFMQSNDLIRFALTKIKNFPKVFSPKYSDVKNVNTVFRIAPSGTAPKVSNFPYKTMLEILDKYNVNDNYYDYSCGWSVRMLSSLSKQINYYGSEPNSKLVIQLNKLQKYYKEINKTDSVTEIYEQGSEVFIPELENKIGLSFSSPPYFDFEDYKYGNQSVSNRTYEKWLSEYWEMTVKNIEKYLIKDGYFLLNIKNIKGYNLVEDMTNKIKDNNFKLIEIFELKNINRIFLKQNEKDNNEKIFVYKKK